MNDDHELMRVALWLHSCGTMLLLFAKTGELAYYEHAMADLEVAKALFAKGTGNGRLHN